jgi:hypothetical protein
VFGACNSSYKTPASLHPRYSEAHSVSSVELHRAKSSDSVEHNDVEQCSAHVHIYIQTMTVLRRAFLQLNARNSFRLRSHRHVSTKPPPASKPKDEPIDIPTSLWHQRLGPVTDFFSWFHRTQQKRPLTVQVCTSLTVYLCGDLLAQEIGGEIYDPTRTLRMLTIGALASIPGYKWWD